MLVFVSKREFGQAFTQSLALFPFIGLAMQNVAESGEKVIEKFALKRQKLIGQLKGSDGQGMFAFLGDLIENYTFDPLYQGDPQSDALALKQKLEGKFTEISGNVQNALDPEKRSEFLNQAQQKFQALQTNPALQELKTKAQERFNKFTQSAGKRLSNKKHKNKKWKTHRKLNK